MSDERDWRETAYLQVENWPEAIPWSGPRREYGAYPWGRPTHDQYGIDTYPFSHPNAASIGYGYIGDVCPMCGVPLQSDEQVITKTGKRGELFDVSPSEKPEPAYHPACYDERQEQLQTRQLEVL
jgi:hypothetical protein